MGNQIPFYTVFYGKKRRNGYYEKKECHFKLFEGYLRAEWHIILGIYK